MADFGVRLAKKKSHPRAQDPQKGHFWIPRDRIYRSPTPSGVFILYHESRVLKKKHPPPYFCTVTI